MVPNDRRMIGAEVDIAIPKLAMAIEWNGVVHFRPIYGAETLQRIQRQDARKKQLAEKAGVELIIVEDLVSTKEFVRKIHRDLRKVIRQKLREHNKNGGRSGFEP